MRWLKRGMWRSGIALIGLFFLLTLMVWVPIAASAHEEVLGLSVSGPPQATPTVDVTATMTALNEEKLQLDISKDRSDIFWSWTSSGVIVVGIAGIVFSLFQFYRTQLDKRVEREKKDEEEFHSLIRDLGNDKVVARIDASITLRKFLRPDYERFYRQVFDWMVINLRQVPDITTRDWQLSEQLDAFRKELITTFKASFPLARTSLMLEHASIPFNPSLLDASKVWLDNADLSQSDLGKISMPNASFKGADLIRANLSGSYLRSANFSQANLVGAVLDEADLSNANLNGANLMKAKLAAADLSGANLSGARLTLAVLRGTDLRGATGLTQKQLEACKAKGAIIDGTFAARSPQPRVSPSTPSRNTDIQTPSAQGSLPTPDASGSSTSVSQQSNAEQILPSPSAPVNTPPPSTDGGSATSSQQGSGS